MRRAHPSFWVPGALLGLLSFGCADEAFELAVGTSHGALIESGDVLGFEEPALWTVTQGSVEDLSATDVRTKGAAALGLTLPSGYVRIESAALSSSQLDNIERGAAFSVDFMLPSEQENPYWFGAMQMYLSVGSQNLNNVHLGQVELTGIAADVYRTLRFEVPDDVADVLEGATFSDLTIGVALNVPQSSPGTYRLDHLRLKSSKLSPAPASVDDISAGESISLVASRDAGSSETPEEAFAQGIIQIPGSFHSVEGTAGSGSAHFQYRFGDGDTVTCEYDGDEALEYVFSSCSNGLEAGELVPADFVRLEVVSGDPSEERIQVRAQIALNPLGDEILPGLAPIPTYFGSSGDEIAAALDGFIEQQQDWEIPHDVRVFLPTPAATPLDDGTATAPLTEGEFQMLGEASSGFNVPMRVLHNDMADVEFRLVGSRTESIDLDTGSRELQFGLFLRFDMLLLSRRASNVHELSAVLTSTLPALTGGSLPTHHEARFCSSWFGTFDQCKSYNSSFSETIMGESMTRENAALDYWVFRVSSSSTVQRALNANVSFDSDGFSMGYEGVLSNSVGISGGLAAGPFAGGGVFANTHIGSIRVPLTVSMRSRFHPTRCETEFTQAIASTAFLSAGGGKIGYYLEGGFTCGLGGFGCWRHEGNLWEWGAIFERERPLFEIPVGGTRTVSMHEHLCEPDVGGLVTYPTDGAEFHQGDQSFMSAQAEAVFQTPEPPGFVLVLLDDHTWSSSDPTDIIDGNTIRYGNPGPRTLTVVATDDAGEYTATSSRTVTILPNEPATAPAPQILSPSPGLTFQCTQVSASGAATDPQGLPIESFEWFISNDPPNIDLGSAVGTGEDISFATPRSSRQLLRLIVTNSDGSQGLVEIPALVLCII